MWLNGKRLSNKVDNISDEEKITLVTGGQAGDFAKKICVPLAPAAQALTYYVKHGDCSPTLEWEKD